MKIAEVLGYTDRLHAAPGETLRAHLHAPGEVSVRLVELASSQDRARPYPSDIDGSYSPGTPVLVRGSYMQVSSGLPIPAAPHVSLWIWPTKPARGTDQGILCWGSGHGLFLTPEGRLEARWGERVIATMKPVLSRRWSCVEFVVASQSLELTVKTSDGGEIFPVSTAHVSLREAEAGADVFCLAAIDVQGERQSCFDGKLAEPVVRDGDKVMARWDLGARPQVISVQDQSGNGHDGVLVNRPQKGMTGPHWRGDSLGWSEAPEEYTAVAFHRDDLSDAEWPVTFSFTIPDDLPSGAYGFEVSNGQECDTLPFFVTPPDGQARAPIAFIVPLFSYLAYANERHWWTNPAIEVIAGAPLDDIVGPLERWGEAHELLSAYDYHSDGSGNAHASLRRPLVNMRADYKHPLLRGPHQLSGDILTLEWLRSIGQPVDIITDYCLHDRGMDALADYQCVITGSHPEYVSAQYLDAVEGYLNNGGNLLHMGGNAFYFVISLYEDEPHIMEVRRGEGGTIPWQSEPGESRQAATGEMSGLWRWRGRSAHRILGTGTAAVSFGEARPFVRTDEAKNGEDLGWVFEGLDAKEINANGALFGGAAGFEVDAMRYDLGTPANTVKLAAADGFEGPSFIALEDVLGTGPKGEAACHITFRKLHSGGQVFSAPSISWTSCLGDNGGNNAVAKITRNVITRFLNNHGEKSNV